MTNHDPELRDDELAEPGMLAGPEGEGPDSPIDAAAAVAVVVAAEVPGSTTIPSQSASLEIGILAARLDDIERSVTALRVGIDELRSLSDQVVELQQLAAEQLRRQGRRVEQASSALSDGRWRGLVTELLLYDDLLAGLEQSRGTGGSLDILRSQMRQLLRGHGIETVAADGPIDFRIHRAVRQVEVDDPSLDGSIVEVWRAGYRQGETLLRPADVVVGVFRAPAEVAPAVEVDPDSPSTPGAA